MGRTYIYCVTTKSFTCKNPIYPCSMSYYFEGAYFIWDSGLHGMHFCKYVAIGCYPKLNQTC